MLDELESHGTVGLESDPMYAAVLARHAAKRSRKLGIKGFLKLTYASATAGDLRAIRRVYEGPIVQLYGATETGVLFMEAEDGLLHHVPFTTHVELLPARVATPGADDVALVVVTTLDRRSQPLVRFVVGDLVRVAKGGPRRYTSVPPLRSVEGRVQDALVRPDGAIVTAGAIDRALDVAGVARFQANQTTVDHVDVDLLMEDGADAAKVCDEARARLLPLFEGLSVSVRTAQALAIESSGRVRLSRRQVPLDLVRSFEGYTEETAS
jgi:phenylacetate-CoA ligase